MKVSFYLNVFDTKVNNNCLDIFDGKTAYQAYTAIHFIFFVFVMTIISMNLTTGLAITNLAKIVENAEYTKLALQENKLKNKHKNHNKK